MRLIKSSIVVLSLVSGFIATITAAESKPKSDLKQFFFEERTIEGKIRRPQLVLIKAEQRPEFEPMVIQSLGRTGDIVGSVEGKILTQSPYDKAFKFREKRIINYIP